MSNTMSEHLDHISEDRLQEMLRIKQAYELGDMDLATAQAELAAKVGPVRPSDIAYMEQTLMEEHDDECMNENIKETLRLFSQVMDASRPTDLPADHPIMCYYRENDEMRKHLHAVEDLVQYPVIKNQWLELLETLMPFKLHLSRKQNQLYSLLEQKGFDRPTTTMWTFDNLVRDDINDAVPLLDGDEDAFIAHCNTLVADALDLMEKEEAVLYPTSLAMISADEFDAMRSGDAEIGFAWIDAPAAEAAAEPAAAPNGDAFAKDLAALLEKHGYSAGTGNILDVATGKLTLDQVNLIYRHMPVDLAYVDENNRVCFYTDSSHRIFPRSKNVIGREVTNCHPRKSVHVVEEIVEKFRNGEEDSAEFWINKPNLFIYIHYVAVRDADGTFRGVLETMQDCTHIRALEGSQTLLNWGSGKSEATPAEAAPANDAADVDAVLAGTATPEGVSAKDIPELNGDTKLMSLVALYPDLRKRMAEINPAFEKLQSPLARVMLPKATLAMLAERGNMPLDDLISKLDAMLKDALQ